MAVRLVRNSLANIASKVWGIIALYVFVPIWIKFLGVEGYGIISFYTILMTIIHFADMGLSATLTREFARESTDLEYRGKLLRTFELVYFAIALLVFVVLFFGSGFIVDAFLKSDTVPRETLIRHMRLMAGIVSVNFIFLLYIGGLAGLQKQVLSNTLTISYSFSRSVLVLIPLALVPKVGTFLIWQLFSLVVIFFITRHLLWKAVRTEGTQYGFHPELFRTLWKFSLGMMLMSLISALNTQLDKLITGHLLDLRSLGYYSLAATVGQAVYYIVGPIGQAFYPELTRMISVGEREQSRKQFLLYSYIVAVIAGAIGLNLIFYMPEFLSIWTGKSEAVPMIIVPATFLVVAYIFVSFQTPPYFLALAEGNIKINTLLCLIQGLIIIPGVWILTRDMGLRGTAIPYCVVNIAATFVLAILVFRKFMPGVTWAWFMRTFLPLLGMLPVVGLGHYAICHLFESDMLRLCFGALLGAALMGVLAIPIFRNLRKK